EAAADDRGDRALEPARRPGGRDRCRRAIGAGWVRQCRERTELFTARGHRARLCQQGRLRGGAGAGGSAGVTNPAIVLRGAKRTKSFFVTLDCVTEPVIGSAFARAVGSQMQIMTPGTVFC